MEDFGRKLDNVCNAILVGMDRESSYLYAGLTPDEIAKVSVDVEFQGHLDTLKSGLEYSLLQGMHEVARKQMGRGRSEAQQWLLEKLYPRYSMRNVEQQASVNFIFPDGSVDQSVVVVEPESND